MFLRCTVDTVAGPVTGPANAKAEAIGHTTAYALRICGVYNCLQYTIVCSHS